MHLKRQNQRKIVVFFLQNCAIADNTDNKKEKWSNKEMKGNLREKLIGDKRFYKMVLLIAVPIMIQNGITNFVSFLDNIMIGQVGTEQMTGGAIVNQLIFVYNLCIFGGVSGAGIFTAQFFGQKDDEGVANTFRFKLWMAAILTGETILILVVFGSCLQAFRHLWWYRFMPVP